MIEKIPHLERLSKRTNLMFKLPKYGYYHNPNEDEEPIEIYGVEITDGGPDLHL